MNKQDEERIRRARERIARTLDGVDWQPDYSKSWEENMEAYRQKFYEAFGAYPEELEEEA